MDNNYDDKIKGKLQFLEGLLKDQEKDVKSADEEFLKNIRKLPDSESKKFMNDVRNKLKKATASKDPIKEVKTIIEEVKNYSLNLNHAN